jgi:hypothetical protein
MQKYKKVGNRGRCSCIFLFCFPFSYKNGLLFHGRNGSVRPVFIRCAPTLPCIVDASVTKTDVLFSGQLMGWVGCLLSIQIVEVLFFNL